MGELLAAIEASGLAGLLRVSRWGYAGVNAAHILGIALLVGAILPLDLRLLGAWRRVPRAMLARVLVPVAATGLALAIGSGVLLFSVKAADYAGLGVFRVKLALIIVGVVAALILHLRHGPRLGGLSRRGAVLHGLASLACWLGALVLGRMIAFAE